MAGAVHYFEPVYENADDIKDDPLETKEDSDSSNTYSGVISGTDDDFHKLKNVVCKLEQISDRLALAAIDDQYEQFAKYLATLLRGIPNKKFLSLKQKLVSDVIQAKMALDESNTPSTVTGHCTLPESVDPFEAINVSACRNNAYQSVSSKILCLQSKSGTSESSGQNDVPVSKTINSEPLKVPILPSIPTITPPANHPPAETKGDENVTTTSSSNSLPIRKRKRSLKSVPSEDLYKKPHFQPNLCYTHDQEDQETSRTEDCFEIGIENEPESEGLSDDDPDAEPLRSPSHINEPTSPVSLILDDDVSQLSSSAEKETVSEPANKLLQLPRLDNVSSSECAPQSPSTDIFGMTVEELDGMPKDKLLQLLDSRKETHEETQDDDAIVSKILRILLGLEKPDEEASDDENEDVMLHESTEDLTQNVDNEENTFEENQEINTNVRKTIIGTDKPEEVVSADKDGDVNVLDSTKDNIENCSRDEESTTSKSIPPIRRRHKCLFCELSPKYYADHVEKKHRDKPEGAELFRISNLENISGTQRSNMKRDITRSMTKKAAAELNKANLLNEDLSNNLNSTKIITVKTFKKTSSNIQNIIQCRHCLGYYRKKKFSAHLKHTCKDYRVFLQKQNETI